MAFLRPETPANTSVQVSLRCMLEAKMGKRHQQKVTCTSESCITRVLLHKHSTQGYTAFSCSHLWKALVVQA